MLNAVRFGVGVCPVHAEDVHEEALRQIVPALDGLGGFDALLGELDLVALGAFHQAIALHALECRRGGGERDADTLGEACGDDGLAIGAMVVDLLQVVFHGGRGAVFDVTHGGGVVVCRQYCSKTVGNH